METEQSQCEQEMAVVVGAGAFGERIIERLVGEGLSVLVVSRTQQTLDKLASRIHGITPCVADISQDSGIDTIMAAVDRPVRIVVHGPGVEVAGDILHASTDAIINSVNIKVGGMLRLVRAVDQHLTSRARLVAIGGHYGFEPTAYAATAGVANAALVNLIRQLSLAYGSRRITAHLIAPGPADTERLRRVVATRAEMLNVTQEALLDEMKSESSINDFTTPEQVAWSVGVLLSPEADAMTGSTLMLDSGRRRGLP
jgi:NAD(P)-dependent dehydrogenase (short-subunit alcohol dehydrogenase family)